MNNRDEKVTKQRTWGLKKKPFVSQKDGQY